MSEYHIALMNTSQVEVNVLEGLRAARVELLVADGVGPHHVPLGRDVVLLQVHAQLDFVVLSPLVDVPEVDLPLERNTFNTLETAYKVPICPRGYLLNMRIYLISNNRPKVTLKRHIWA